MVVRERVQSIIATNLALRDDETLLVVTDDPTREVGELFYEEAQKMRHDVQLMIMPEGHVAGGEPPAPVSAAMKAADVAVCPTAKSITHTSARIEAAAAGTRVVTMPGITLDMLRDGGACADYDEVEELTRRLTARLTRATTARIEKDGHSLTLDLAGRVGVASPGIYRTPGSCGNFPSGEAYIAPREDGANGTMAIDGSMVGVGTLAQALVVTLHDGLLTDIAGGDENGPYADRLSLLFARPENGTIAELGIGTNKSARLCGVILEDEKLYGTVHLAFGTNVSFGGTTKADCHYDGVIQKPTLYLDDECVIRDGEFC